MASFSLHPPTGLGEGPRCSSGKRTDGERGVHVDLGVFLSPKGLVSAEPKTAHSAVPGFGILILAHVGGSTSPPLV